MLSTEQPHIINCSITLIPYPSILSNELTGYPGIGHGTDPLTSVLSTIEDDCALG